MREIKFRGKRIDNGEWVYGCLIIEEPPLQCFASENKEPNKYLIGKSGFADWNMQRPFTADYVHPESIGQFTGLRDKNGKEIYEGDIIARRGMKNTFVEYIRCRWVLRYDEPNVEWRQDLHNQVPIHLEVIGNLYENPDLLNG